jgi:hypothetical protein
MIPVVDSLPRASAVMDLHDTQTLYRNLVKILKRMHQIKYSLNAIALGYMGE